MKSIATRMATNTSAVPRSGWRKTRKVGIPISTAAPTIVDSLPIFSRLPESQLASTTIISTLLTSLTWKSSPATLMESVAPLRLRPMSRLRTRRSRTPM